MKTKVYMDLKINWSRAVVISTGGAQWGRAPMLKLLFIFGGKAPPTFFALTLLFKVSSLSINSSRSLVFKDRDINCISLVLSFIPSILPFYVIIEIYLIVDYTI